jgi:hypothetical protein
MRPDGFINTPPVASVVSPQYAIVNTTTEIEILVSDVNIGDDVRCRWSTYTPGYRRRKRSDDVEEHQSYKYAASIHDKITGNEEIMYGRKIAKRSNPCTSCANACMKNCPCSCAACAGTTCSGPKCMTSSGCPSGTTTIETPGTLAPTSSYPHLQAIDECGGICYPSSMPNGTILSGCTLSFQGLVSGAWYAVAIQVDALQTLLSIELFCKFDNLSFFTNFL